MKKWLLVLILSLTANAAQLIYASKYGSNGDAALAAAISAIGSLNKTLYLDNGIWPLTSNLSLPDNVTLFVERGSYLSWSTNIIVRVRHLIDCEYQIFACPVEYPPRLDSGSVMVSTIRPEWFGAIIDGTTDCAGALQTAIKCAYRNFATVQLPIGTMLCKSGITLRTFGDSLSGGKIKGHNMNGSIVSFYNEGSPIAVGFLVDSVYVNYLTFEDFAIYGNGTYGLQKGFSYSRTGSYSWTTWERVQFYAINDICIENSSGIVCNTINCRFGSSGIGYAAAGTVNKHNILHCQFAFGSKGVRLIGGYGCTIRDCLFDSMDKYAIFIAGIQGATIDGNYFEFCGAGGLTRCGFTYTVLPNDTINAAIIINGYNETNVATNGPCIGISIKNNSQSPAVPVGGADTCYPFISAFSAEGLDISGNGCHPNDGGAIKPGPLVQIFNPRTYLPSLLNVNVRSNARFTNDFKLYRDTTYNVTADTTTRQFLTIQR